MKIVIGKVFRPWQGEGHRGCSRLPFFFYFFYSNRCSSSAGFDEGCSILMRGAIEYIRVLVPFTVPLIKIFYGKRTTWGIIFVLH